MRLPRYAAAALVAVCLAAPAALLAQTPTLGELARTEQERRRALTAPGRVITEADLLPFAAQQLPSATASLPADAATAPPLRTIPNGVTGTADVRDEAWWRRTMGEVREDLGRADLLAAALQSRISALTNDAAARDDPHQRNALAAERQRVITEHERLTADRDRLKKKLADLEEEARRNGVPPGWLR